MPWIWYVYRLNIEYHRTLNIITKLCCTDIWTYIAACSMLKLLLDTSDFIGCYSHSSGIYSSNKKTQNNLMHVQLCIEFCYKSNFSLAALSGIGYKLLFEYLL